MRRLLLLPLGLALVGVGLAAGTALSPGGGDAEPLPPEIVVQGTSGDVQVLTPDEAAARIESLESLVRRREQRVQTRLAIEEADGEAALGGDAPEGLPAEPPLVNSEGRPYTAAELRELALHSDDPELRAAAIRALRRDDSSEARATLQEILADPEVPKDLRLLAARALVRWPHRDHLPEELIVALKTETDPDIRLELMRGVASLRDRRAYMKEISTLLHDETDPAVRKGLLGALTRASRDPAARQELLHIATTPGASAEERYAALRALRSGRPDADTVAALRGLLDESDPAIRAGAMRVLASDRGMPLATLRAGLADSDPGVRQTALYDAMRHLGRIGKRKDADKAAIRDTQRSAAELARSDPNPDVRRAALNASGNLPRNMRNDVIANARNDNDDFVRLTAYAWSPRETALSATQDFVGALSSPDARLRDFAYRQLRRLHGVKEPYQANWNDNARTDAIDAIRQEVAASPAR